MSDRIEARDILSEDATAKIKAFNDTIKKTAEYAEWLSKVVNKVSKADFINSSSIAQHNKDMLEGVKILNKFNAEKLKGEKQAFASAQQLEKEAAAINKVAKEQANANSAYKQASDRLLAIKKELKDLDVQGKSSTEQFRKLNNEFKTLDGTVRKADAKVGEFGRNVGNYNGKFNGLGNSINQLTREMPSFANSMQTGFMAISNNLPIFFDEIAKTKAELIAMKAEGKAVPSLFASIAGSIFTWGTALSIAVTLLTVFGKEMVNFIVGLSDTDKALKLSEEGFKSYYDAITKKYEEYRSALIERSVLEGSISQERADIMNKDHELNKKLSANDKIIRDELIDQTSKWGVQLEEVYNRKTKAITKLSEGEVMTNQLRRSKDVFEEIKLNKERNKILNELAKKQYELNQTDLKTNEVEKQNIRTKAFETLLKSNKGTVKKDETEIIDLSKQLRDAETNNITNSYDKQKAELTNKFNDDYELYKENAALILELKTKLDSDLKAVDDKQKEDELKAAADHEKSLIELRKAQGNYEKIQADKNKALKDKEAAEDKARMQSTFDFYDSIAKAKQTRLETELDNDIDLRQRNILQQQQLAIAGKDNTLAFEKAAAAKDELRKQELAKKEETRQKRVALFKLIAAYADKGDSDQATSKAFIQMAIAGAIAGSYFEGTENVGEDLKGNKLHNGRDGYRIAVDGSERILTGAQNKLIGDLSNDELAQVARAHNEGVLPKYITDNGVGSFAENLTNSLLIQQFTTLNSKIQSIEKTLKERPSSQVHLNNLGDVIDSRITNGFHKKTVHKSNSKLNYI